MAGSWRLWWRRGWGAATSWSSSSGDVPVTMQDNFQQCFDLKVPQIQFIDSGWIFLLCCRDGYPQYRLCR